MVWDRISKSLSWRKAILFKRNIQSCQGKTLEICWGLNLHTYIFDSKLWKNSISSHVHRDFTLPEQRFRWVFPRVASSWSKTESHALLVFVPQGDGKQSTPEFTPHGETTNHRQDMFCSKISSGTLRELLQQGGRMTLLVPRVGHGCCTSRLRNPFR